MSTPPPGAVDLADEGRSFRRGGHIERADEEVRGFTDAGRGELVEGRSAGGGHDTVAIGHRSEFVNQSEADSRTRAGDENDGSRGGLGAGVGDGLLWGCGGSGGKESFLGLAPYGIKCALANAGEWVE